MSQHHFILVHQNLITEVIMGWNHPTQSYFMVIEKPELYIEQPFWVSLTGASTLSLFLIVLKELDIQVPNEMVKEAIEDKLHPQKEKKVYHALQGNHYMRYEIPILSKKQRVALKK